MRVYISIDDTDNHESFGTGRMSRMLAENLEEKGMVRDVSVTRHQLLVHPAIPYTSHNSCACIEADALSARLDQIFVASRRFLLANYHIDSNPGICVHAVGAVRDEVVEFGLRAQKEVLTMHQARTLAARLGLLVWRHGKTGQGIIGAMSGVGLRSTGNDGRFIGLRGIRKIKGTVTVSDILKRTPITAVLTEDGSALQDGELVNTLDWVRPALIDGRIVLTVLKEEDEWRTIEKVKRSNKPE
jgi:hypothetical protein